PMRITTCLLKCSNSNLQLKSNIPPVMKSPFLTCLLSVSLLLTGLAEHSEASVLLARYTVDGDTKGTLTDSSGVDPAANGTWPTRATAGPEVASGIEGFTGEVLDYLIHGPSYANQPITLANSGEGGRLATDFSAEGGFTINLRVSLKSLDNLSPTMILISRWTSASPSYRSFLLGINYDGSADGYRFYGAVSGDSVNAQYVYTQAGIVGGGIYDVSFTYLPGESISISAKGVGDTPDIATATN